MFLNKASLRQAGVTCPAADWQWWERSSKKSSHITCPSSGTWHFHVTIRTFIPTTFLLRVTYDDVVIGGGLIHLCLEVCENLWEKKKRAAVDWLKYSPTCRRHPSEVRTRVWSSRPLSIIKGGKRIPKFTKMSSWCRVGCLLAEASLHQQPRQMLRS